MAVKIYHGDILFTPSADRLEIHENSYIIVEEGVVSQICEKIPEQYQGAEVADYGDKLIIPAFFRSSCTRSPVCTARNRYGLSAFRLAESLYISAGIPFPEYGICEKLLRCICR